MNSVKGILPVIDRGLKVIDVGGVFELDANRIPILRSGTSTDLNGEDRSGKPMRWRWFFVTSVMWKSEMVKG